MLIMIGASLTEPHTSGTALRKCVYLLVAIYCNFEISAFKCFMKIDLGHVRRATELSCLSAALAAQSEDN